MIPTNATCREIKKHWLVVFFISPSIYFKCLNNILLELQSFGLNLHFASQDDGSSNLKQDRTTLSHDADLEENLITFKSKTEKKVF